MGMIYLYQGKMKTAVGAINTDGIVRDRNGVVIGRVDQFGNVYYGKRFVGRVANDGSIFSETGRLIGWVRRDGVVFAIEGRQQWAIGEVDGPPINLGGAALLLLLR